MGRVALSLQEREEIALGLCRGEPLRVVARRLGRAPSTLSREVRRADARCEYRAVESWQQARVRARRPKTRKLEAGTPLGNLVCDGMRKGWSPQQIAARMRIDYPDDEAMRVSHETIYTWFYLLPKGGLKDQLLAGMRQGKHRRGAQRPGHYGRARIANILSIDERPDEIAERKVPGHWEGDLLVGKRLTCVGTLVERTTRLTLLVPLPDGRSGEATRTAVAATITELPEALRKSLTWDQGSEMAQHQQFTVDTGVTVYFAHPRSPWERGTNENTNGLLRQYLPRSEPIPNDPTQLREIAAWLNGRPRRTLGWKTPAEAFSQLLDDPVASTG